MKNIRFIFALLIVIPGMVSSQQLSYNWSVSQGGTGIEHLNEVCSTPDNGFIAAGNFTGAFSINGTTYNSVIGGSDIFLVKYNQNHSVEWVKTIGNACLEHIEDIAVDQSGQIYITGSFYSSLSIDNTTITSAGSRDMFVASFDQLGHINWLQAFGGTGSDEGTAIAVSASGSIFVAGTLNLANFPLSEQVSSGISAHIAKMNSNGTIIWSICESGDALGEIIIEDIAADDFDNTYVTGYYFGSVAAGNNGQVMLQANNNKLWVGSYNANGLTNYIYTPQQSGAYYNSGTAITLSHAGNPVVTGFNSGAISFGNSSFQSSDRDLVAFELNSAGSPMWSNVLIANGLQHPNGISCNYAESFAITGLFIDDFNTGLVQLTNHGSTDAFVVMLKAGSFENALSFGTSGEDNAVSIFASNNSFTVAGSYSGGNNTSMTLGSNLLQSNGDNDFFVTSISENTFLGMEEASVSGELSIYPNPAVDYINVKGDFNSEQVTAKIYNVAGALINSGTYHPGFDSKIVINIAELPAGIYTTEISDGKNIFKGKFIAE